MLYTSSEMPFPYSQGKNAYTFCKNTYVRKVSGRQVLIGSLMTLAFLFFESCDT